MKNRNLIIIGDSAFAQIAYHYFTDDTDYKVIGFSVEREFLINKQLFDLPVIPFDELTKTFAAKEHDVFVAVTYGQLNRLRTRLMNEAKTLGYSLASYISPYAFVSKEAKIGEHCFVFENNVIQPYSQIGDNVILWSGNHIGHHSKIGSHCFVSSHVVVSGFVSVGEYCFFGVNSTIANSINIGNDCWLGPATIISKDAPAQSLFPAAESQPSIVDTHKFFKLQSNAQTNTKYNSTIK